MLAASYGCRVILFEPQPHAHPFINATITLNGWQGRVRTVWGAVSEGESGGRPPARMKMVNRHGWDNWDVTELVPLSDPDDGDEVPVWRIDDFVDEVRCRLITDPLPPACRTHTRTLDLSLAHSRSRPLAPFFSLSPSVRLSVPPLLPPPTVSLAHASSAVQVIHARTHTSSSACRRAPDLLPACSLSTQDVALLKIDAEGHEDFVVKSASALLSRSLTSSPPSLSLTPPTLPPPLLPPTSLSPAVVALVVKSASISLSRHRVDAILLEAKGSGQPARDDFKREFFSRLVHVDGYLSYEFYEEVGRSVFAWNLDEVRCDVWGLGFGV